MCIYMFVEKSLNVPLIFAVVRQALMQNQTPEIQAKLLAMQRMMQNPSATLTPPTQPVIEKPQVVVTPTPSIPQPDPAAKPMTQEQREERMRYLNSCMLSKVYMYSTKIYATYQSNYENLM